MRRLLELRKKHRLSQLYLAMELHMSQNTISRYETGVREPCIDHLIRIADYFDASIDILSGELIIRKCYNKQSVKYIKNKNDNVEAFSYGFRLGIRLMIEVGMPLTKGST